MSKPWKAIEESDSEIYQLIELERTRQENGIELIASENIASKEVVSVMGNVLTNKYAEGLPNKRYYGGCEYVDDLEIIAINRAKELFGAKFANVQPHSGAQANGAVFLALCKAGDRILGMDLSHGGHLTHGSKVNFSGILYDSHFYSVDIDSGLLDYDKVLAKAREVKPKMIVAGASAYSRGIDFKKFREIADEVGAYLLVDMAHIAGLVAAGLHQSPVPYAHVVTTTTHKTLRGPRGGLILWNDENLKINKSVFPGLQGGPLEHIIAAKAVCFKEALNPSFRAYQSAVLENSKTLAKKLISLGFKIVSGGTDNHLLLVDLSNTKISGKILEETLDKCGITTNKNTVPNEKRSPFVTSGLRLGTPAVTSRGMGPKEMEQIGIWIKKVFDNIEDEKIHTLIKKEVREFTNKFPIYPNWL